MTIQSTWKELENVLFVGADVRNLRAKVQIIFFQVLQYVAAFRL